MAPPNAQPFAEKMAFKELGNNKWETVNPPERLGNAANIAFGGFAVAIATQAACKSVPEGYHLYTIMGNFLGPALTDRPLRASTKVLRQTRTFATCQIEVSQELDGGGERACLVALADFQVQEKRVLMEYSAPPRIKYSHYNEIPTMQVALENMIKEGKLKRGMVDAFNKTFNLMNSVVEIRSCPEGVYGQTLNGLAAKYVPTTQDNLPFIEKATAEWGRYYDPPTTPTANITALAFFMDSALSFAPLAFSHKFLNDVAACSSLDFALRVFSNEVNLGEWFLREITTHAGAEGRTYSEGRLWDESGKLLASMTQQGIMRALPDKKEKEKL